MASKMPSLTALLGMLAIAGYQNRDKIAEMLKGVGATENKPGSGTQPALGGVLGNLGGAGVTASEVFWAAALVNCSTGSSRPVWERLLSRGSSTRQTACFRVKTVKTLNHRGTRDGYHLDDHHRVYRGRYR
jgi:uncharacterized protein YidB (DUF937 family)